MEPIKQESSENIIKGSFTVKLVLTEYGKSKILTGNSVQLFGQWLTDYNRAKQMYIDLGYKIVHEDVDRAEFTVEK